MKNLPSLTFLLAIGFLSGCSGASIGIGGGTYGGGTSVGLGVRKDLDGNQVYKGKVKDVETKDGKTTIHFEEGVSYEVDGVVSAKPGDTVKIKKTKTGYAVQ